MPGRLIGFLACLGAAAGCYSPPEPDCGFVCGPGGACPADYTCASDHHCHRNGAAASLTCGTPPVDAAPDTSTGPQIVSVTPADGATDVPVDTTILALADQGLQGSPDLSVFFGSSGAPLPGSAVFLSSGIQFVPDAQLIPNEHYAATTGSGVVGLDGIPLAPYHWSFDTGADTVPPRVTQTDPVPGQTGVPVTTGIIVFFDEQVTGVDATTFTAVDGATPVAASIVELDPRTYELRPVSSLSAGSTITVSLTSAIVDLSGNPLAQTTFPFTTAP